MALRDIRMKPEAVSYAYLYLKVNHAGLWIGGDTNVNFVLCTTFWNPREFQSFFYLSFVTKHFYCVKKSLDVQKEWKFIGDANQSTFLFSTFFNLVPNTALQVYSSFTLLCYFLYHLNIVDSLLSDFKQSRV